MIRFAEMDRCSFCGKTREQVDRLIQGGKTARAEQPPVFICDGCVKLCAHVISEPVPERHHDELYLPLAPWSEIEVDGERYRWSAARVTMSEHDARGRLTTRARPVVMLSVGKLGEPAVGVMHDDGTEPSAQLAVEAIRRMLARGRDST
ncbi:MAG: ClpX C4-type zinc finger protein [Polyangiaceae bacterium]|nr:ClpX C4-type zinc finger protein [Polyangiaceae bacterium]